MTLSKRIQGLTLSAAALLALGACTTDDGDSAVVEGDAAEPETEAVSTDVTGEGQTITFWHAMGGDLGLAVDQLVDRFNETNELDITVVSEFQGTYDDAITKLRSASLGNLEADVVQIYDIGSRYMLDSGYVVPMQDFIDSEGYDISQIEPNIAAYYTVNDDLYSMPFNSSTPVLYYNVDMFEEAGVDGPPESLSEIEDMHDALVNEGGADMPIALTIYGWFVEQFTAKQGLDLVNNGNGRDDVATEVSFMDNDAMINILEEWYALYESGAAPNVGREGGRPEFVSGQAAMTLASTSSLSSILNEVDGSFEVGTAYLPAVKEGDDGGVSIGGASLWALESGNDEKEQASWEFIKFLISPEIQADWASSTGYFPITTATHEEDVFKENIENFPQFQTAIDQLHESSAESQGAFLSVFPEARQIIENEIENMLNGVATPEEAAEEMAAQINSAIENYNLINTPE